MDTLFSPTQYNIKSEMLLTVMKKILQKEEQKLNEMKQQYHSGENIGLSETTLDKWNTDLIEKQHLVEWLRKCILGLCPS